MSTYADSGVNIELGDDVSKILYNAAKETWKNRKGKLGELTRRAGNLATLWRPPFKAGMKASKFIYF